MLGEAVIHLLKTGGRTASAMGFEAYPIAEAIDLCTFDE